MTLVEVIASVALVTIVVVSLGTLSMQSAVFSKRIDIFYTATCLGQRRIDLLKRLGFDQIPSTAETNVRIGADGNISESGNYLRTTEVETNYGGNASLARVKVTVQRVKVYLDGSILDPDTGEMTYMGSPVIMETLFTNIE
jgi:hypothetical protein